MVLLEGGKAVVVNYEAVSLSMCLCAWRKGGTTKTECLHFVFVCVRMSVKSCERSNVSELDVHWYQ